GQIESGAASGTAEPAEEVGQDGCNGLPACLNGLGIQAASQLRAEPGSFGESSDCRSTSSSSSHSGPCTSTSPSLTWSSSFPQISSPSEPRTACCRYTRTRCRLMRLASSPPGLGAHSGGLRSVVAHKATHAPVVRGSDA